MTVPCLPLTVSQLKLAVLYDSKTDTFDIFRLMTLIHMIVNKSHINYIC